MGLPRGEWGRPCYLQVELLEVPGGRQRPGPAAEVAHPIPGQERGAREELVDLRLVQPQVTVNLRRAPRVSRSHGS